MEKRNVDHGRLIAEARQLRVRWHTGEYVSVSLAVALANKLADAVEAEREDRLPGQASDAA